MSQTTVTLKKQSYLRRLGRNVVEHPLLYLMFLPVVAYYVIFHYAPMYGVVIAFQDYKPMRGIAGSQFVGLKHFQTFVNGPFFWRLVRNTLSINIGMLLFAFPMPIIFALMLNEVRSVRFRKMVQTVTYMPHFVSSVVVCGLMLIFCRSDGIVTIALNALGLVEKTNLLTIKQYFQPLYILMNIWQELGWDSIIYFAALTAIDAELYEAATVDGAGRWRRMWHITIPGILPTIVMLLILRIGNLMSLGWDRIYLLQSEIVYETSDVISTYVYRTGLVQTQYSYATAVGLMNSVVNVILLFSANAFARRVSENSLW
ncbi:MAG: ABC transporter permease [Christensenellales bacterium]